MERESVIENAVKKFGITKEEADSLYSSFVKNAKGRYPESKMPELFMPFIEPVINALTDECIRNTVERMDEEHYPVIYMKDVYERPVLIDWMLNERGVLQDAFLLKDTNPFKQDVLYNALEKAVRTNLLSRVNNIENLNSLTKECTDWDITLLADTFNLNKEVLNTILDEGNYKDLEHYLRYDSDFDEGLYKIVFDAMKEYKTENMPAKSGRLAESFKRDEMFYGDEINLKNIWEREDLSDENKEYTIKAYFGNELTNGAIYEKYNLWPTKGEIYQIGEIFKQLDSDNVEFKLSEEQKKNLKELAVKSYIESNAKDIQHNFFNIEGIGNGGDIIWFLNSDSFDKNPDIRYKAIEGFFLSDDKVKTFEDLKRYAESDKSTASIDNAIDDSVHKAIDDVISLHLGTWGFSDKFTEHLASHGINVDSTDNVYYQTNNNYYSSILGGFKTENESHYFAVPVRVKDMNIMLNEALRNEIKNMDPSNIDTISFGQSYAVIDDFKDIYPNRLTLTPIQEFGYNLNKFNLGIENGKIIDYEDDKNLTDKMFKIQYEDNSHLQNVIIEQTSDRYQIMGNFEGYYRLGDYGLLIEKDGSCRFSDTDGRDISLEEILLNPEYHSLKVFQDEVSKNIAAINKEREHEKNSDKEER